MRGAQEQKQQSEAPGLFLSFQIHGHHPPRQIFHPLLIGQLRFGLAVELPYLVAKGVILPHLRKVGVSDIVLPVGKDGLAKDLLASLVVLWCQIQVGLRIVEGGGDVGSGKG